MRRIFARKLQSFAVLLGFALMQGNALAAGGEAKNLPVPNITIYPGDKIKDDWLVERDFSANAISMRIVVDRREGLVGKIARRTLLPGVPVPVTAVSEPRLVTNGEKVKMVYTEGGLTITAYGSALQAGAAGDVVTVRNLDSGLTISGIVQTDGSILINGG